MDQELLNQLIMQFESVSGLGMGGPLQNIFSSMGVNPLSPASSSASATLGQDESLEMLLNSGSMRSNLRVLEIINAEEKNDPEKESFLLLALEEICQRYRFLQLNNFLLFANHFTKKKKQFDTRRRCILGKQSKKSLC